MREPNPRAPAALAMAALAWLPANGCGPALDAPAARAAPAPAQAPTKVVTVAPRRATVRRTSAQPGQVEASELTAVHSKASGYVRSLAADIGDQVKRGQVLAEIDMPEVEAELAQKRAMVEQAEADRKQAEAAARVAEAAVAGAGAKVAEAQAGTRRSEAEIARWQAEFARIEQLTRESAISGALLDETRSKREAARASREEVGAQVKSAEAARDQAAAGRDKARADVASAAARVEVARADARRVEALVGFSTIRAPFDGVVTRRNFDPGHLTMAGAAGEPLFVVARAGVVTVAVGVPEVDAPFVNPGDPVQVRLQALPGRVFDGRVARTAWALDAATRTLRVEVDLPNPDDVLRPGLYAYATVVAEEHPDALTLPAAAIVKEADRSYCVAIEGNRARRKEVRLGIVDGKRVEVLSGLAGGERVVEANAASLADGQPVEPSEAAGPKP